MHLFGYALVALGAACAGALAGPGLLVALGTVWLFSGQRDQLARPNWKPAGAWGYWTRQSEVR